MLWSKRNPEEDRRKVTDQANQRRSRNRWRSVAAVDQPQRRVTTRTRRAQEVMNHPPREDEDALRGLRKARPNQRVQQNPKLLQVADEDDLERLPKIQRKTKLEATLKKRKKRRRRMMMIRTKNKKKLQASSHNKYLVESHSWKYILFTRYDFYSLITSFGRSFKSS